MPDTNPFNYPPQDRPIWKTAYVLKNGHWCIQNRTTLNDALRLGKHCAKLSIPFRLAPIAEGEEELKSLARNVLSYLTCSYNTLIDRNHDLRS